MEFSFVRRTDQEDKHGRSAIYFQATENGKPVKFSLKDKIPFKITKNEWTGVAPKWVNDNHPNANRLNFLINQEHTNIQAIILDHQIKKIPIKFDTLKLKYLEGGENIKFSILHQEFMNKQRELVDAKKKSASTLIAYNTRYNKVIEFAPNLTIAEINLEWIENFEHHLLANKKNAQNTRVRAHLQIREVLELAIKKKIITENPYKDFEALRQDLQDAVFLEESEVKRLQELFETNFFKEQFSGHHRVLKEFLLACFTGIDYAFAKVFDYSHITQIQERDCIDSRRAKKLAGKEEGHYFTVPINEQAKKYLDLTKKEGLVLDTISNQPTNLYLKKIAKMVGIRKIIKFHTARHTFATMSLNMGVPLEVLQKWLGHKNIQQTQHYAKMLKSTASNAVKNWDNYAEKKHQEGV